MNKVKYNDNLLEEVIHTIDAKLDAIIIQTTKTNGRVSAIENWRSSVTGAMLVITSVLIPIAFKLFFK